MIYLGVDTGGTFTDFVLFSDGQVRMHKILSTPEAPERAILQGISDLGVADEPLLVIHGSTVATNAVLEGKGVKTAYITNQGFADVLTIGRQNRRELYNLQPHKSKPPVPAQLCLQVDCRLAADGRWLTELAEDKVHRLVQQLRKLEVQAVAINLLFSYMDNSAEMRLAEAVRQLPADIFVSVSSAVLGEIGEYERGMATWLNAWVGPLIQGYVGRLQQGLGQARLSVMQSSGETMAAELAAQQAVRMLLSGPAGGLVGARFTAGLSGFERLMTFDMGGTSSDVALLDRRIALTSRSSLADYPVAVPMVDMHTIGAGGGSIARLDEGGMLQVGPASAGASPGPACYALGGEFPTVTDANLVLGRIPDDVRLGGAMALHKSLSQAVIAALAEQMGVDSQTAARGILDIANEHMARALRVISVQKGYDPQDFILVSFGGAGGLHVCDLADALGMTRAMVPVYAGVLSALGMLVTSPGRQLSHSVLRLLDDMQPEELEALFAQLLVEGETSLAQESVAADQITAGYSVDLRYRGQSNTLNIDWSGSLSACQQAFHDLHQSRYGHALNIPVELVNIRVSLMAQGPQVKLPDADAVNNGVEQPAVNKSVPVVRREAMPVDSVFEGPAIIVEAVATTWVGDGWQCHKDNTGNLLLSRTSLSGNGQ